MQQEKTYLIELKLLADSCESNYALEVNGYSQGVNDAIDLVKKLTIPVVVGQSEQLVCSCGSIKVKTTGGSQCPNNRCSSAN